MLQPTPAAVESLRQLLRSVMSHEKGGPLEWQGLGEILPEDFVSAVSRHRVAPTIAPLLELLPLPDDVAGPVRQMRDDGAVAALRLVRGTGEVQARLTELGISSLVLKGCALAAQTVGDPKSRGFGDLDLLVAPTSVREAVETLVELGYSRPSDLPQHPSSWASRYHLATAYELSMNGAIPVDLHWRPDFSPSVLASFDELWAARSIVAAGPFDITTLGPLDALRHSAVHAAKDDWRWLRSLVDVHRLARHPQVPLDWPFRLSRAQLRSVAVTEALLGPVGEEPVGRAPRSTARARQSQERPEPKIFEELVVPNWLQASRQLTSSDRRPRSWILALASVALPVHSFRDLAEPVAGRALPRDVSLRVRDLQRKLRLRLRVRRR